MGSRPGKINKPITDGILLFCPILLAFETQTYKLAKIFVPMLEPITVNECSIKDPFSYAEKPLKIITPIL